MRRLSAASALGRAALSAALLLAALMPSVQAGATEGIVELPVPAKMIYTGQPVTTDMLVMRRFRAASLKHVNYLAAPMDVTGKVAKSTLVPNRPIDMSQLREPWLIEASRPVRIYFRANGVVIGAEAIPLQSAHAGDIIPARNRSTGRVVSGLVLPDGTLEVVTAQ
jgi:flagella basal body P-ring formation protein FlgA